MPLLDSRSRRAEAEITCVIPLYGKKNRGKSSCS
uniref:Uncharacterized protein n=1 Tax=Physcomitrium patens TaxID=3218 RepID=A0A2K1JVM4_PHYPA|nr:hypothetical protein PHYPA_015346 [Physcomitrium patens]